MRPSKAIINRIDAPTARSIEVSAPSGSKSCQASNPSTADAPITGHTRRPNCRPTNSSATSPTIPANSGIRNQQTVALISHRRRDNMRASMIPANRIAIAG